MPRTGREYVEARRDGRCVYINGEKVDDVTTHPAFEAFEGAMRSIIDLYDFAADSANREVMT